MTLELEGARKASGWILLTQHGLVLELIRRRPGRSTGEIAKLLGQREKNVYRMVTELVQAGYVSHRKRGTKSLYHRQASLDLTSARRICVDLDALEVRPITYLS